MQMKTIKSVIENKLNEWLLTINDIQLRKDVKENLLVSGGSITSMLLNEPVNDYDVYLMKMDIVKRVAEYYTKDIPSVIIFDGREKGKLIEDYNSKERFDGVFCDVSEDNNSTAISLRNLKENQISLRNLKENQIKLYFEGAKGGMKINDHLKEEELNYDVLYLSPNAISLSNNLQIVLRFWGTNEEIHKTFDFIHATNYFTFKDGVVRNLPAIESILTKQLKYQGSYYPVTSIIRAKKFIKRGFNIGAGELLKIMFQISQLDLNNPDVLEEQLIGVDVAYFDLLITALRNKMTEEPNFKLSTEYFNELINRIFGE